MSTASRQFEVALCVTSNFDGENEDFREARETAFDLTRADFEGARQVLREELCELIGPDNEQISLGAVSFIDFDSANPGHASAYFMVEATGPALLIMTFAQLRGEEDDEKSNEEE